MSEQTPESTANTADEDGFDAADAEPSMEDILASIRKIISDDADPVALDGPAASPVDAQASMLEASAPVLETAAMADVAVESAALDDDAFDIDALLGDLDMAETPDDPSNSLADMVGLGDAASLDDGLAIPEIEAETVTLDQDEDDMDRLMGELLGDMDEPQADPTPEGPIAAAVAVAPVDDDMDVVKSLMADLTDAPIESDAPQEGPDTFDMDALMGDFDSFADESETVEAVSPDTAVSDVDDLDAMEDDIFDSILEMTLDDEVAAFDAQSETDLDVPSLSDIASAAESEAIVEPAAIVGAAAVATAAVVAVQTADDADIETVVTAAEPAPIIPEPAQPAPSEMEIPMPSALRSDAILDDVTESATMSAFAELNQVVEDKAILSERGPRIGDLVQDALKPMLKEWLDENIQGIVERAVAKEVKRIATGK